MFYFMLKEWLRGVKLHNVSHETLKLYRLMPKSMSTKRYETLKGIYNY